MLAACEGPLSAATALTKNRLVVVKIRFPRVCLHSSGHADVVCQSCAVSCGHALAARQRSAAACVRTAAAFLYLWWLQPLQPLPALSADPTSTAPLALDAAGARVRGLLRCPTPALPSAPLFHSWVAAAACPCPAVACVHVAAACSLPPACGHAAAAAYQRHAAAGGHAPTASVSPSAASMHAVAI